MSDSEYQAAVADFIRNRGITHCPTVCAVATQASVAETDRMALRAREAALEARRRQRAEERLKRFSTRAEVEWH